MLVRKEFFDLQLTFAERVCVLSGRAFEQVLLEHTNLYVRFGLGREFDAHHPIWRAYLAGLPATRYLHEYTYDFYLRAAKASTAAPVQRKFGCFSWACEGRDAVRLHFVSEEQNGVSPLSHTQCETRRGELRAMFAHANASLGDSPRVIGISWLYNLEAYRRLFPPTFVDCRRPAPARFRGMSLWGQFLNHRGQLRQTAVRHFLSSLAGLRSAHDLASCFPLQVLTTEAPIQQFYAFYGL
jgi:hypothetical protein